MPANTDWFDLCLVISAMLFHLSIVGVYIAQKQGRDRWVKIFGTGTLLLAFPLAAVFFHYLFTREPIWKLVSFGFIFFYLLVEWLLDFVFKVEFRQKLLPHMLYILLFYIAIIGFIRMSFAVNVIGGYAVSVSFWILLGALIYNLAGHKNQRSV